MVEGEVVQAKKSFMGMPVSCHSPTELSCTWPQIMSLHQSRVAKTSSRVSSFIQALTILTRTDGDVVGQLTENAHFSR